MGIGTEYPDANLSIGCGGNNNLNTNYEFSILDQYNGPDIFTVDIIGNTYIAGTISMNGNPNIPWSIDDWNIPFTFPSGSAMRTSDAGANGLGYLGFGMTYNGWYWIQDATNDNNITPNYPMSLIFNQDNNNQYILSNAILHLYGAIDVYQPNLTCPLNTYGAGNAGIVADFNNGNNSVFTTVNMPNPGDYNPLTLPNDNGIFWSDNGGLGNLHSGLVIAPHAYYSYGMRIDATGDVTIAANSLTNLWTTYSGSPYAQATSNTNGGWTTPLIIPNGGAIRTSSKNTNNGHYLGFGMVDEATTGWYLIVEPDTTKLVTACYPMTLILDGSNSGTAILTVSQNGWCDFVFDSNYNPMTYQEKENYYKEFKHLPGIDPETIVREKGLNITKNMKGMLQNIEEDRLDITKLYEKIEEQQKKIEELEGEVNTLKEK